MRFRRILTRVMISIMLLIGLIYSVHAQEDANVYLPFVARPGEIYFPVVVRSVPPTPTPTPTPTPPPSLNVREEVFIPAGPFQMGCDQNNPTEPCRPDERPLHTVNLNAYYIDKYEVTTARYKACADAGICRLPRTRTSETRPFYYGNPIYADYPVLHVSWSDAGRFCAWEGSGCQPRRNGRRPPAGAATRASTLGETVP